MQDRACRVAHGEVAGGWRANLDIGGERRRVREGERARERKRDGPLPES
jgi:hypothetical protein